MSNDLQPPPALSWLLEPDPQNPGVRYFALRILLDRPEDDPDVLQARRDVMTSGPVPAILAAQDPQGYWFKPGSGYSPKYEGTVWQIIFLAELGADPADERVRRGCEYLLDHSRAVTGTFSAYNPPRPSGGIHCLNGNLLHALLRLGYGGDPRWQAALDWEVGAILGQDGFEYNAVTPGPGFACGVNGDLACGWGAVKAIRALAALPAGLRTPAAQAAIQTGVDFLFSRNPAKADYPYTRRVSSTWFKLGFPLSYWSDVLEIIEVLAALGYGRDPRLAPAIEYLLGKQDARGRWKLENRTKLRTWIKIDQPDKWITLRALKALKACAAD